MLSLLLLSACQSPETSNSPVNDALTTAADASGVPRELLAAIAWTSSRFDNRGGAASTDGAVGLMALNEHDRAPRVADASRLIRVDADRFGDDDDANVRGAAALLREKADAYGRRTGNPVDTYEEWYPVTAWFSGAEDPLVAEGFADQVYDWMQFGLVGETPDGEMVEVAPVAMPWRRTAVSGSGLVDQFVAASSSNYSNYSRGSGDITTVVIHTMQGSYSGSISWFQNPASGVSAHYMVRSSDGQITQMVQEEDVAWHAGYWDTNLHSVGIELEGYIDAPSTWYTDAMYQETAALTRDICDRYGIPVDRTHIIGHDDVPGCSGSGGGSGCHTDPGTGWDWDRFLGLVSGSSSAPGGFPDAETDGPRTGTFNATVTSARYGETDTCAGEIAGAVNMGQLYLTGKCTLANNPDKATDLPVTWSGTISGGRIDGRMVVDGRSADFVGAEAGDGAVSARFSGTEDLGGEAGELAFEVAFSAGR